MLRRERHLADLSSTRLLRSELLSLASMVAGDANLAGELNLTAPVLSEDRLVKEWEAAKKAFRPQVTARLAIRVRYADGRTRVLGSRLVRPHDADEPPPPPKLQHRLPRRDLAFAVEKLLVWSWLEGKGPVTRKWLQRTAGCTYPTVAGVVKRLGSAVHRHSDRRIELAFLPPAEWSRVVALAPTARATIRFADRSGQPTTASALLRRLHALKPAGVAVGGVSAAQHRNRELDLTGLPRLDLSVHAPGRVTDLDFVRQLDPALKRVEDPAAPAVLALHFVRHEEPLFEPGASVPWADAVESLLDLYELGLYNQAAELLDALRKPAAANP